MTNPFDIKIGKLSIKRHLRKFVFKNERLCEKLNRSQKFYYWGIVLIFLSLFWLLISVVEISFIVLCVAIACLSCGVISDILIAFHKTWNTSIGKGMILIMYAALTNVAYAASSQFVNILIQYDSSALIYTTNFVAVLLIPFFLIFVSIFVFYCFILLSQLYMLFIAYAEIFKISRCLKQVVPEKLEEYLLPTFIVRLIVIPMMMIFFQTITGDNLASYIKVVESSTKGFIYNLEANNFSRCKLEANEKAININDNEIVIVKKIGNDYKFIPTICNSRLET